MISPTNLRSLVALAPEILSQGQKPNTKSISFLILFVTISPTQPRRPHSSQRKTRSLNGAPNCTTYFAPTTSTTIGRHIPLAEPIIVLGTLLPYPFLPQHKNPSKDGPDDNQTREHFLQLNSLMQLFCVHNLSFLLLFLPFICYVEAIEYKPEAGLEYTVLPPWTVCLNLICLFGLDHDKMKKTPRRHHTLEDFEKPAAFNYGDLPV
ncbi:hypothetical protein B0T14DRAFT_519214 [Immersiella caudata]|uniref:Uncharacterized protein n=1 Tax=Immersiella caudata TaxID=314043 RepID=A0AA39WPU8_9PEZI|nr:hypothetical protein B0T14DRAFT_519214 [Immersiella caudata]